LLDELEIPEDEAWSTTPIHYVERFRHVAGRASRCGSSSTAAHSELEPSRTACARGPTDSGRDQNEPLRCTSS
jgi:hypothetical protein